MTCPTSFRARFALATSIRNLLSSWMPRIISGSSFRKDENIGLKAASVIIQKWIACIISILTATFTASWNSNTIYWSAQFSKDSLRATFNGNYFRNRFWTHRLKISVCGSFFVLIWHFERQERSVTFTTHNRNVISNWLGFLEYEEVEW